MSLCQETPSDAIRQRADETSAVEAREIGAIEKLGQKEPSILDVDVIPAESFIARSRVGPQP